MAKDLRQMNNKKDLNSTRISLSERLNSRLRVINKFSDTSHKKTMNHKREQIFENLCDRYNQDTGVYELFNDGTYQDKNGKLKDYCSFYGKNLSKLKARVNLHHNFYRSMNKFRHHRATTSDLAGLTCCFFDLDTLKQGIHNFDWKELIHNLPIKPTAVIFSGHGFYLIYLFKNQITLYNQIINEATNPILLKWKHVEIQLGAKINEFSELKYHKKVVDPQSISPSKILRCSNSRNNKYLEDNSTYLFPVNACVLRADPNCLHTLRGMADELASKWAMKSYQRYKYVKNHSKHYAKLSHNIAYIRGVADYKNGLKKQYNHLKNKLYQLNHPSQKRAVKSPNTRKYYRQKEANIRRLSGFIEHISNPDYQLYGHVELSMFIFLCLTSACSYLTDSSVLTALDSFTDNVIKQKLNEEHKPLTNDDEHKMLNRLHLEFKHFSDPRYNKDSNYPDKKALVKDRITGRFYYPTYKWINSHMEFSGKLYRTQRDKRRAKKQAKQARNHKIKQYSKRKNWTIEKLSVWFHLNKSTIYRIINK